MGRKSRAAGGCLQLAAEQDVGDPREDGGDETDEGQSEERRAWEQERRSRGGAWSLPRVRRESKRAVAASARRVHLLPGDRACREDVDESDGEGDLRVEGGGEGGVEGGGGEGGGVKSGGGAGGGGGAVIRPRKETCTSCRKAPGKVRERSGQAAGRRGAQPSRVRRGGGRRR